MVGLIQSFGPLAWISKIIQIVPDILKLEWMPVNEAATLHTDLPLSTQSDFSEDYKWERRKCECKKYFRCWSCRELYTNYFWEILRMKGCIKILTLLTTKCGFRLSYHSSSAWSLYILQTSSRQIRARLTCLGLIGHAHFCPQILSGRKGESEVFLYLCEGFLGVQWPRWKYYAVATPVFSVQKPQILPQHLHRSAAENLWVQHFQKVSEGFVVHVAISCESRAE